MSTSQPRRMSMLAMKSPPTEPPITTARRCLRLRLVFCGPLCRIVPCFWYCATTAIARQNAELSAPAPDAFFEQTCLSGSLLADRWAATLFTTVSQVLGRHRPSPRAHLVHHVVLARVL